MTSFRVLTSDLVMERDRRLTGFMRGQTDRPEAPKGFELNNPWRVSMPPDMTRKQCSCNLGRATMVLDAKGEEQYIHPLAHVKLRPFLLH